MIEYPLAIADVERVGVFLSLQTRRGVFQTSVEGLVNGVPWRATRVGASALGISPLGPGRLWDAAASEDDRQEAALLREQLAGMSAGQRSVALDGAVTHVRFGPLAARVAWSVHLTALRQRSSLIYVPDQWLARQLWGNGKRPRSWRHTILELLFGLSWLHVADWRVGQEYPEFGSASVLITHAGDLRGTPDDRCPEHCWLAGGERHQHFQIDVGPGFLGILERCATTDDGGIRTYVFPSYVRKRSKAVSLQRLGKSGRLQQVFVPALVGEPEPCCQLTQRQHRLLQALTRELTRPRSDARSQSQAATVIRNRTIPSFAGRDGLLCSQLDAGREYVAFNGNGVRSGRGYRIRPSGWLGRTGYDGRDRVNEFLSDLDVLSEKLALTAVAVGPDDKILPMAELVTLVRLRRSRELERVHLRVYGPADFAESWSEQFGSTPGDDRDVSGSLLEELSRAVIESQMSRRQIALEFEIDSSFLSKVLAGKKPLPRAKETAVRKWLDAQSKRTEASPRIQMGGNRGSALHGGPLLPTALAYLSLGWSVIPQIPATKKPYVPWTEFQSRCPTSEEWRDWARRWPEAGLILILGPVSGVMVVDVDGEEPHRVLLDRLGSEPFAPRVRSGDGDPHRFHLYFRHPDCQTRPKITPWHPHLEFRGHRGIIVLPPSRHRSGNCYRWDEGRSPDDIALPPLPEEILSAIKADQESHARPPRGSSTSTGAVPVRLADVEVSPRTKAFLTGEFANDSGWNERLFAAACDLHGRGVLLEVAMPALRQAAGPWNESEGRRAEDTIRSAYSRPREPSRH
jgi:hypothetical protein